MALDKGIENVSGVVVTYWKVSGLNLSFTGKRGCIILAGYLNKETRDAEKEQVTLRQINIKHELYDQYFNFEKLCATNIIELAYAYIVDNDIELIDSIKC